jgi:hypothetical protein
LEKQSNFYIDGCRFWLGQARKALLRSINVALSWLVPGWVGTAFDERAHPQLTSSAANLMPSIFATLE